MKTIVQSIKRAFEILRVVHRHRDGVGIGDLATETRLHTSTTSRIVSTLEYLGAFDRVNGKLFIGEELVTPANRAPWTEH